MTKEEIQRVVSDATRSAPAPETADSAAGAFADGTIGHLRGIGRAVVELRALVTEGVFGAAIDGLVGEDDQLDKLTKRIGIAAEELQILRRAMEFGEPVGQGMETVPGIPTGRTVGPQTSRPGARDVPQSLGPILDRFATLSSDDERPRASRAPEKVADQTAAPPLAPGMPSPSDPSPPLPSDLAGSDRAPLPERQHDGQIQGFGELGLAPQRLNAAIKGVLFDALASRVELVSQALPDLVKPPEAAEVGASSVAAPRSLGGPDQVGDSRAAMPGSPPPIAGHPIGGSDGLRRVIRELDHAATEAAQVAAEAWHALLEPPICLDKETTEVRTAQRRAAAVEQDGPIPAPRGPRQSLDPAPIMAGHGVHALTEPGKSVRTPRPAPTAIRARVVALPDAASRSARLPLDGIATSRTTDQGSALPAAAPMALPIHDGRSSPRLPDFALPHLPAAPDSSVGSLSAIAADIAAIKANTARMAEQGIL